MAVSRVLVGVATLLLVAQSVRAFTSEDYTECMNGLHLMSAATYDGDKETTWKYLAEEVAAQLETISEDKSPFIDEGFSYYGGEGFSFKLVSERIAANQQKLDSYKSRDVEILVEKYKPHYRRRMPVGGYARNWQMASYDTDYLGRDLRAIKSRVERLGTALDRAMAELAWVERCAELYQGRTRSSRALEHYETECAEWTLAMVEGFDGFSYYDSSEVDASTQHLKAVRPLSKKEKLERQIAETKRQLATAEAARDAAEDGLSALEGTGILSDLAALSTEVFGIEDEEKMDLYGATLAGLERKIAAVRGRSARVMLEYVNNIYTQECFYRLGSGLYTTVMTD